MRTTHLFGSIFVGLAFTLHSTAHADPVVDGRYDSGEGYDVSFSLTWGPAGTTTGHFSANPDSYFFYIPFPTVVIDNTYGLNSVGYTTTSGPFASDGNTDPDTKHKFAELLGSDQAEFRFGASSFTIDYLEDESGSLPTPSGYGSLIKSDSDGAVLSQATSLDYNLNVLVPGGGGNPDDFTNSGGADGSSPNTTFNPDGTILSEPATQAEGKGWSFDVAYEYQLDKAVVGDNLSLSSWELVSLHLSPSKRDADFSLPTILDPTNPATPEPSAFALSALGLLSLSFVGWRRRRR